MTTTLYKVTPGQSTPPLASDINQFVDLLNGLFDAGVIQLASQISAPSTTGITATAASGTALGIGAYSYKFTYVVGYKKSDGTVILGNETNGSASVSVTTTSGNQAVNLAGLPTTWPTTAVALRIYRTAVGGADGTQKLVATLTTAQATYSDTVADGSLGTAVPTTNATGTTLQGTASSATNVSVGGTNYPGAQTATANTVVIRDANGNAVSALPVTSGQNANLLFNPSARLGMAGWAITNAGGSSWAASFGSTGDGGYFNCGNVTNATPILTSTKIPASSSLNFTLSVEMYSAGVTAGTQACDVQFLDASSNVLSSARVNATSGVGSWKKYILNFTTPANTAYLQVRLYGDNGFTTTNSDWRKIKVEYGSIATTFSDDNTLNTQQYGSVLPLLQAVSGGNKVQSGITTSVIASSVQTVTFPTAFTTGTTPQVFVMPYYGTTSVWSTPMVTAITATAFSFDASNSNSMQYMWLAIGS